jgi:hypothetical protein
MSPSNTGHWFLVAGCWLLVAGYWLLVAGRWSLVAVLKLAVTGSQVPVASNGGLKTRIKN